MIGISIDDLRKMMSYDPETGALTWRERPAEMFSKGNTSAASNAKRWNWRFAGKAALAASNGEGYLCGTIFGRTYKAHRVAWALHHGKWPAGKIDHENGIRSDNRASNLRDVNDTENCKNRQRRSDNTSGVTGIYWYRTRGVWLAKISGRHLGYFASLQDAVAARKEAERNLGYHPNHDRDRE